MKRFALLAVVLVAVVFSLGATQQQANVTSVLDELKLEFVEPADGRIGGPMEFRITKETIAHMRALRKAGKAIVVNSDGTIETR